jgi:hypothetical protein
MIDLENIDIKAWAKQIRVIKINELKEYIGYLETENKFPDSKHPLVYCHYKMRISELKAKLSTLEQITSQQND